MKDEKKEFSSRRYPEKDCFNPNCDIEPIFKPHDRRQKFCKPQCRVNYYNDKRSLEDKTTIAKIKQLRLIDKKLDRLYTQWVDNKGYCVVHKDLIEYEGIDVMLLTEVLQNPKTEASVKVYFRFSLELHPKDLNFYIIHKL